MMTDQWNKSSRSNPSGNCLETRWKKSTRSGPNSDNCVEAQIGDGGTVQVRDTKLGETSPILNFTRDEWAAFLGGAKDGEFDLPA
jgi:hypothetical protein